MGTFRLDGEIVNMKTPTRRAAVPKMVVDTGAEFTWAPERLLRTLGVAVSKKDQEFVMANGRPITRDIGYAIVRAAGFETVDEMVFGHEGDLVLIGARTLEGFGAMVDSRRKRLVAAGPHLAA